MRREVPPESPSASAQVLLHQSAIMVGCCQMRWLWSRVNEHSWHWRYVQSVWDQKDESIPDNTSWQVVPVSSLFGCESCTGIGATFRTDNKMLRVPEEESGIHSVRWIAKTQVHFPRQLCRDLERRSRSGDGMNLILILVSHTVILCYLFVQWLWYRKSTRTTRSEWFWISFFPPTNDTSVPLVLRVPGEPFVRMTCIANDTNRFDWMNCPDWVRARYLTRQTYSSLPEEKPFFYESWLITYLPPSYVMLLQLN